jgi:RimJ/RimL family protein N-acetyltransferase
MPGEHPPDAIRTTRLFLRCPRLSDAETLFASYAHDPDVARYTVWTPHRTVGETHDYLVAILAQREAGTSWTYIIDTDAAEAVGAFTFHFGSRPHSVAVGYVLARRLWGQGYMTDALVAAVDWAFTQPQVSRLWAVCDSANAASARVMEKAGLQFEGILRRWETHPNVDPDHPRDCRCYARVT